MNHHFCGKKLVRTTLLLTGLAVGGTAGATKPVSHAEQMFSSIDLSSPPGPVPSMERTLPGLIPVIGTLDALGPLGLLEADSNTAKLTLIESFADGSQISRVYTRHIEAAAAFDELETRESSTTTSHLKNGYAYYAVVEGNFWNNGNYGYRSTYGSRDGRNWILLSHVVFLIP